jgi:hypothetical protein
MRGRARRFRARGRRRKRVGLLAVQDGEGGSRAGAFDDGRDLLLFGEIAAQPLAQELVVDDNDAKACTESLPGKAPETRGRASADRSPFSC